MKRISTLILLLIAGYTTSRAQELMPKDSLKGHDPRRAAIYSVLLPGLGQAYNESYWKIGVVYGAIGGLGVLFQTNNKQLKRYQNAYTVRLNGGTDTDFPQLSDNGVRSARDFHRRNRDIAILGFVAVYALQIIDANVDAHLQEFRTNKDLSLKPSLLHIPEISMIAFKPGINFTYRF